MTERASPRLGTAPASLRAAVRRLAVYPAWVAFVAVAAPFLAGVAVPLSWQYAPLVASAVLFGMPHGAVDHLVPRRLSTASTRRSVAVVVVLYAVLGGAYLAWWFLHPVSAAVGFVLLTWAHWGQGDVYLLRAVDDDSLTYPRSVPHRLLTLVVRGAMPMAVPLVADATQYRGVGLAALTLLTLLRGLVVRRSAPATANATAGLDAAGGGRPGTVTPLVTLGPVALVADRGLRVDAVELGVLWLFFLAVPPVLAVGLYFCLWHALRHVVRLIAAEASGSEALRAGDHLAAFGRFARQAAPLTAVALAMVGGLYALVPVPPGEIGELVGLYLVLIAVLTLPHVVVVAWMDRVQGVWTG
ncbi:beta-carotene 15,15'-monooxygenase [Halobacteriales archaeon SW_7_71_33]|nr:MAG: beta-carotene 15,15'-monooxygenase [Halobacteriales archaeon SW_7_71_33]